MKKIYFTLFVLFMVCKSKGQDILLERVYSINVTYGVNVSREVVLHSNITSKIELGLNYFYRNGDNLLIPILAHDLRWYYNLQRRVAKSKNIEGNSGDFCSIYFEYRPDWFVIPGNQLTEPQNFSIIPTWGLRRQFTQRFSFEFALGVGSNFAFYEDYFELTPRGFLRLNLGFRL